MCTPQYPHIYPFGLVALSISTADMSHSRSALCCHRNETRAPIANPPNSAQLEGTSTIRVCAVVWECGEGQTDTQTHRRP